MNTASSAAMCDNQRQVLDSQPLVRSIARRMVRRLPVEVEVQELISVGNIGLMEAVARFDGSRGVPFPAYAEMRIRGAMVDYVRTQLWVPRSVVSRARKLDQVRREVQNRLGHSPTREEMADYMELQPGEYDAFCDNAVIRRVVSGDQPLFDDGSETVISVQVSTDPSADDCWMTRETLAHVRSAIEHLPTNECTVITMYYFRNHNLKQIGEKLGLTEGRISQIRKQAIAHLRAQVADNGRSEAAASARPVRRSPAPRGPRITRSSMARAI